MLAWITKTIGGQRWSLQRVPELALSPIRSFPDYNRHVAERREISRSILAFEQSLIPDHPEPFPFAGHCFVCRARVDFRVDFQYAVERDGVRTPNWRERLLCPRCQLNNRMRAVVHIFNRECRPRRRSRIYLTEQTTALYHWFRRSYPHVVGSEYLGEAIERGGCNGQGIRNEDLTRLSFGTGTFDYILSFDVLEHVPDYRSALVECLRCLKPGGTLLFSVPFVKTAARNLVRATVSDAGEVSHLLPPEYHGDPINPEGCLCFYHFGWELLDDLRSVGFADAKALLYWSKEFGYLGGEQLVLAATKGLPRPFSLDVQAN